MNQTEDVGVRAMLCQSGDNGAVGGEIARGRAFEGARFNVKDIDQYADRGEDVGSLARKIGLCECILPARVSRKVPEVESGVLSRISYPPQSHKLRTRLPKNFMLLCSTSMVAPRRRTSFAT